MHVRLDLDSCLRMSFCVWRTNSGNESIEGETSARAGGDCKSLDHGRGDVELLEEPVRKTG